MKTLIIGLTLLASTGVFALNDLNILILADHHVQSLIQEYRDSGIKCDQSFGQFHPFSKTSLQDSKISILACKNEKNCGYATLSHFSSIPKEMFKLALLEIDKQLKNFPADIETVIIGQMECGQGIGQRGISVLVGEPDDELKSNRILSAHKY